MYQPSQDPWRACAQDAANVIRVHGHCKLTYQRKSGEVCLVGAIQRSGHATLIQNIVYNECYKALKYDVTLQNWNDEPSRTAQEVIDLLELVAVS